MEIRIRVLDDEHDRAGFTCGVEALDHWLCRQAGQAQRRRLASVWVASLPDKPECVVGYYSLAPWQIAFEECPEEVRRGLPRYPIPAVLIARLAVARAYRGRGVGGVLLVDALMRANAASTLVPVQVILVHAKDEHAARFYEHYGFRRFPGQPNVLFLPIGSAARLA